MAAKAGLHTQYNILKISLKIAQAHSWVHLGHVINNRLLDSDDASSRKTSFIAQTNSVLCNFLCNC